MQFNNVSSVGFPKPQLVQENAPQVDSIKPLIFTPPSANSPKKALQLNKPASDSIKPTQLFSQRIEGSATKKMKVENLLDESHVKNFVSMIEDPAEETVEDYFKLNYQMNEWMKILEVANEEDAETGAKGILVWLGHIFSMKGMVNFGIDSIDLEGLNQVVGMSFPFESYLHSNIFKERVSSKDQEWIKEALNTALLHSFESVSADCLYEKFTEGKPVFFASGWSSHSTGMVVWKVNDLVFMATVNKGGGSVRGKNNLVLGINQYMSLDIASVDKGFFEYFSLANDMRSDSSFDAQLCEEWETEFGFKDYKFFNLKSTENKKQKVGNCSYATGKLLIRAFLELYYQIYLGHSESEQAKTDFKEWDYQHKVNQLEQFLLFKRWMEEEMLHLDSSEWFYLFGSIITRYIDESKVDRSIKVAQGKLGIPTQQERAIHLIDHFLDEEQLLICDMVHSESKVPKNLKHCKKGSFILIKEEKTGAVQVHYFDGESVKELPLHLILGEYESAYSLTNCEAEGNIKTYKDLVAEVKKLGIELTYPISTMFVSSK